MRKGLLVKLSTLLTTIVLTTACGGQPGGFFDQDGSDDGAATGDDGGSTNDGATSNDGAQATDTGSTNDAGGNDAGVDTGVLNSSDGFGAARTACINEINKLRATESHAAYALWETTAIDTCVDEQATYDQTSGTAHDAWTNNVYPTCNGNGQDECLGYGNSPSQVVACLDAMWAERLQSNCAGCAKCNGPSLTQSIIDCQSTSTCDFYGNYGGECGHYLNMSADYFTMAACGFSTKGTTKDWSVQNFQ